MACSQLDSDFVLFKSRALRPLGPQQVIVCYQRSLKLNQKNGYVYSIWAEMLQEECRYIESNKIYRLAAIFASRESEICYDWIDSLYALRRFQDVLVVGEKIIDKVFEPAFVKNRCGMCYIHFGDYEKALKSFEEASQLDPFLKSCHLNQVLALYLKKEYTRAVHTFEEIKEISFLESSYRREIGWIEQGLVKRENEEAKERLKYNLKGFNQILVMLYKRR